MHSSDGAIVLAGSRMGEPFSDLTTHNQVRMLENELKSIRMQNIELDKKNIKLEVQYDTLRYTFEIFN
jgi:hypothetical protein